MLATAENMQARADGDEQRLKDILFESRIPEEVVLYADQSLMTQLALNLMENAVKYGKQGGCIVCEAKRRSHQCELYIRDDGIGIGEDELPRVFDRFYRADAARDRSGTGLGLSIVRWIVEAHHGRISIQSAKGRGTTVAVILPDQL